MSGYKYTDPTEYGYKKVNFSREDIRKKDDSLDLAWIRDEKSEDSANLPEPDVLINEALEEMAGAMNELKAILVELGAAEDGEVVL